MPRIKLYADLPDDTKLGKLPEVVKWRFVQLLLLAGECDAEGYLVEGGYYFTAEDIAWRLRIPLEQFAAELDQLRGARLLVEDEKGWLIGSLAPAHYRRMISSTATITSNC